MIVRLIYCSLLAGCVGTRPAPPAATYQRSQIVAFKQTAIMDTVTAVLDGQVVDLCTQQPLPVKYVEVKYDRDQTRSITKTLEGIKS